MKLKLKTVLKIETKGFPGKDIPICGASDGS